MVVFRSVTFGTNKLAPRKLTAISFVLTALPPTIINGFFDIFKEFILVIRSLQHNILANFLI